MHKRQIWDRVFLGSLIFLTLLSVLLNQADRSYYLVRVAGAPAYAGVTVLAGLAALGLLDVVINDILPEKYSIGISLYCRQFIWMLTGVTLMGFCYVLIRHGGIWESAWYILLGARCASVAFLDLHYELKGRLGSQNA